MRLWATSIRASRCCAGSAAAARLAGRSPSSLADLVVQLTGDAGALPFLGSQGPAAALPPLALQPVEHRVQRLRQGRDLTAAA